MTDPKYIIKYRLLNYLASPEKNIRTTVQITWSMQLKQVHEDVSTFQWS